LITNVRGVANDSIKAGRGLLLKKITNHDFSAMAVLGRVRGRVLRARLMQLDPAQASAREQ